MNPDPCSCNSAHAHPFDHFLLTRFSVPNPHGDEPTDNWLQERFKLFERYCLPSVQVQSCPNFKWGLLIGPSIKSWALDRLKSLGIQEHQLVISQDWRGETAALEWMHQYTTGADLLTSRIDSDDAISRAFVERLHRTKVSSNAVALNFTRGLQVTHNGLLLTWSQSNPFISLRIPGYHEKASVLGMNHDEVSQKVETLQIHGKPAWLQVIHDSNLANSPNGIPVPPGYFRDSFPVPLPKHFYKMRRYPGDVRIGNQPVARLRHLIRRVC